MNVLKMFTVGVLGLVATSANATMVGRRAVGAFIDLNSGFSHAIIGQTGGTLREVTYQINSFYVSRVITTFGHEIVGVGGFYQQLGDKRHAVVTLSNGDLWDVSWPLNGTPSFLYLANFGSAITAVSGWNELNSNNTNHAAVGLANGQLYEWSSSAGWILRWNSGQNIADISGYAEGGTGTTSHIIANTNNGVFYDLTFGSGSSTTDYGFIYQGSGTCPLTGIVSMSAYLEQAVYNQTKAIAWANTSGNECDGFYMYDPTGYSSIYVQTGVTWNFGRGVMSIAGFTQPPPGNGGTPLINHQVTAMSAGDVYDIYTENGTQSYSYYYIGSY